MHIFWQAALPACLMLYFGRAEGDKTTIIQANTAIPEATQTYGKAAPTANLGIWNLDKSCTNYHDGRTGDVWDKTGGKDLSDFLQAILTVTLHAAIAAQDALKFCLGKRPDSSTDKAGYLKWVRISKSIYITLGIVPYLDKVESANDQYWVDVFKTIDNMVATLQASHNNPAKGYNTKLSQLTGERPMIICGDNWQWLSPDSEMPDYDNKKLVDVVNLPKGAKGSWYKNHRFIFRSKKKKPIVCGESTQARTITQYDYVVFCDVILENAGSKTDWPDPDQITEGYDIRDLLDEGAQAIAIHEMIHWFSGVKDPGKYELVVDDISRVDANGYLIYEDEDGNEKLKAKALSKQEMRDQDLEIEASYDLLDVYHLSRTHKGETAGNSGPAKATKNAQSLTTFLIMMYYGDWNWANDGKARKQN